MKYLNLAAKANPQGNRTTVVTGCLLTEKRKPPK